MIEQINPILRGWVQYFAVGHSSRWFSYIRELHWSRAPAGIAGFGLSINCRFSDVHRGRDWVEKKIRHHLMRASQRHGFGWKRWSKAWLYGTLGLFDEYRVAY